MTGAVFEAVLRCSLEGTLVGLVVLAVRTLLGNRIAAKWRMLLWWVMLLRLMVPVFPESAWSVFSLTRSAGEAMLPPAVTVTPEMAVEQAITQAGISWVQIALTIWAIGAGAMLCWMVAMHLLLHWRVRRTATPVDTQTAIIFTRARERMGAAERIVPLTQTSVKTPALLGVLRPRVLITPQTERMTAECREMIFMHELAHHCRGDALLNHLLLLIGCVYWFNPALWGLMCLLRRDMERAADEAAMRYMSGEEHRLYGQTLIEVLDGMSDGGRMSRILSLAGARGGIRARLKHIARYRRPTLLWSGAAAVCLVVVAAVCLTSAPVQPPAAEPLEIVELPDQSVSPVPVEEPSAPAPVQEPVATLRVEKAPVTRENPAKPEPQPEPAVKQPPKVIMPNLNGEYLEGVVDMLYAEVEQGVGVDEVVQMLEQSGKSGGNDLKTGYVHGAYHFAEGSARTVEGIAPDENGTITLFASGNAPHMANVCFTPAGEAMPAAEYGVLADDRAFSFTGFDPQKRYDITISAATRDEWEIDGEFVVY